MECTLATLIACFSWSGLYVDSEVTVLDRGVQTYINRDWWVRDGQWNERTRINGRADNPYGRVSIGYQLQFPSVTLSFQAEHTSSLATTDDRGVNGLSIKARWFPFRR